MRGELPEGWKLTAIGDVAVPEPNSLTIGPFGSDLKVSDYRAEGTPLVFVRDIRAEEFGGEGTRYIEPAKAQALSRHWVRSGDLLVTKMGDPPGDTTIYPSSRPHAVITADCIRLTPDSRKTDVRFLKHVFRSDFVREQVAEQSVGVAQQKLSLERFKTIQVPLPPLPEQRRIVAKLEELQARTRKAREALNAVPALIDKLRQSVLAAAFRGELTGSANGPQGDLKLGEDSVAIPGTWPVVALKDLVSSDRPLCYGVVQPGDEDLRGVPLIRVQDMSDGTVRNSDLRTVSAAVDQLYQRSRVQPGDVLISLVGTIGRCAIVPTGVSGNIARAIARIACDQRTEPNWLLAWLSCPYVQWHLTLSAREVARKTLNLSELSELPVPLPPLSEQRRIALAIESALQPLATMEREVATQRQRLDELDSAILAKAFRGDLV